VRGASHHAASGSSFVVTDHEAPNGTAVTYRARGYAGALVSAYSSASPTTWSSAGSWGKALDSTKNIIVRFTAALDLDVQVRNGEHPVLGRQFPVVLTDVAGGRRGTINFRTRTNAESAALVALLGSVGPLFIQPLPAWGDADGWFVVQAWSPVHADPKVPTVQHRAYAVTVVEVDRPVDV